MADALGKLVADVASATGSGANFVSLVQVEAIAHLLHADDECEG